MFFYIGDECPFTAMSSPESGVYLDHGWKKCTISSRGVAWYKGYSTECVLADTITEILGGYQPTGKWCVIFDRKIHHPKFRGFPVYQKELSVTNIQLKGYNYVSYPHEHCPTDSPIGLDDAATQIGDILLENTKNFFKFNKVAGMNLLFTCGLDSMTAWAILDYVTKDYTLEVYLPKDTDRTFHGFHGVIRKKKSDLIDFVSSYHWGYDLTSDRIEENWHMTGFYSERIQLREADHISAIANHSGKTIKTITRPTDYLHWFCQRPASDKFLSTHLTFDDQALKDFCFSSIFHDYQMWHLDNNFHFSPFFDIRIAEVAHRMSVDDILRNSLNGLIQREIIKRFRPDFLELLAPFKNEGDIFGNFRRNFKNIVLDPKVKLSIR